MIKTRLIETVKDQLLASEGMIGMVADKVKTQHQTIKKQLISESPKLCLPHYVLAIKEVLNISEGTMITETYSVNQPADVHE